MRRRGPIFPALFPPKARRFPALGYKSAGKIGKTKEKNIVKQIIVWRNYTLILDFFVLTMGYTTAAGAIMTEGSGSRVKFDACGVTVAFHRPHKPKTARGYQVALAREFLENIGVKP